MVHCVKAHHGPDPLCMSRQLWRDLPPHWLQRWAALCEALRLQNKTPDEWHQVHEVLIAKEGDETDLRPIAIAPFAYRVWASEMACRLTCHLEHHRVLPDAARGFRFGKSAADTSYSFSLKLEAHAHARTPLMGISLDLSKAFGRVACSTIHECLLAMAVNDQLSSHLVQAWWQCHIDRSYPPASCQKSFNLGGRSLPPVIMNMLMSGVINGLAPARFFADDMMIWHSDRV